MTKVKICGLTRFEDAWLALELGADELGFILAPSPRRIDPAALRELLSALRAQQSAAARPFRAVGVFVNESPDAMREIMAITTIDVAQVHGDETPEACSAFDFPWYRVVRPTSPDEAGLLCAAGWNCQRILAEASVRGAYGGTGKGLAPELALAARASTRAAGKEFFLAGGLGPSNVADAILLVSPDGVDLSSGVEEAPGIKSAALLEALFAEVRRADRELAARKEAADAAR
ncbi:MAG: hypothetical protein M0001_15605 [Treponema sp.]|nr:hypothetical protein [Treponema sp.]